MSMAHRHRELVDIANRIVRRQQQGRLEVAAEIIARALATSDTDQTFALALALTEQALLSVEQSRLDAVTARHSWRPAMRSPQGVLITPTDVSVTPIALAMRLMDAMHRSMLSGEDGAVRQQAVADLGTIYEIAAAADSAVFHGLFVALATYAAYGRSDNIDITVV